MIIINRIKHISGLDGLRALAALLVLIYHYVTITKSDIPLSFIFKNGWVGVDIFFVISGFILFLPFAKATANGEKLSLRKYFKNRFFRILPAYYFNIFVLVTVFNPWFLLKMKGLFFLLLNLSFLEGFFSLQGATGLNGVFWTLCIEMQFYLLLPLIYKLFIGRNWIYGLSGSLIFSYIYKGLVIYYTNDMTTHHVKQIWLHQIPGVIDQFAIGMALGSIWLSLSEKKITKINIITNIFAVLGFGLLIGALWFQKEIGSKAYWFGSGDFGYAPLLSLTTVYALAAALIIFGVCYSTNFFNYIFSNRILNFLGVISYGIYIWHLELGRIILKQLPKQLLPEQQFIYLVLIGGLVTLIWAAISYYFIELPFLKKKNIQKNVINSTTNSKMVGSSI